MKSSIAKLTNSPAKQSNYSEIHNQKLKAKFDADTKAYQDSLASYQNLQQVQQILNEQYEKAPSFDDGYSRKGHLRSKIPFDIKAVLDNKKPDHYSDLVWERTKKEVNKYLKEGDIGRFKESKEKGYFDFTNKKGNHDLVSTNMLRGNVDPEALEEMQRLRMENINRGIYTKHTLTPDAQGAQFYSEEERKEYMDRMKPTKPEEPNYREISKPINMETLKNIHMPVAGDPELKKALPIGIRNDRYYSLQGVPGSGGGIIPGRGGNRLILKDQSGREIERFTNMEEYQEKYGYALSPGTKTYGQENLKRRLYPQGYKKK